VLRRERAEAPCRLLELPLAAHPVAPSGLIPRDGHVHEALEEILLLGVGGTPDILERLVRLEVFAASNLLEADPQSGRQLGKRGSQPPIS
jgi:hypothetical protein